MEQDLELPPVPSSNSEAIQTNEFGLANSKRTISSLNYNIQTHPKGILLKFGEFYPWKFFLRRQICVQFFGPNLK
jgi:apolipoprotein N-acyltransferase